jgi:hypothetical protein
VAAGRKPAVASWMHPTPVRILAIHSHSG